jgi:indolepyruvate ferredoxin oxidoreductase alpha subunit
MMTAVMELGPPSSRRAAIPSRDGAVVRRFDIDADICTGDRSCIRLSGCPSLTIVPNPDTLRGGLVTAVTSSCVGCGLCGELAHADVLCPSFHRVSVIHNPNVWDRLKHRVRTAVIERMGKFVERRLAAS